MKKLVMFNNEYEEAGYKDISKDELLRIVSLDVEGKFIVKDFNKYKVFQQEAISKSKLDLICCSKKYVSNHKSFKWDKVIWGKQLRDKLRHVVVKGTYKERLKLFDEIPLYNLMNMLASNPKNMDKLHELRKNYRREFVVPYLAKQVLSPPLKIRGG